MISLVTWVQLPEHFCLPVYLFSKDNLAQWSAMMMMKSSMMPHFSTSCGNSQVEGNEILLALPGREITLSLSPIRHQRTPTGQCVLERWQYLFCPHRVISFVVKLAAEIWYLCPIQSTVSFPHLYCKALFLKKKQFWQLPCKCHILWAWQFLQEGLFFFFFGRLSVHGLGLHAPGSPFTQYRNGHCKFLSEASLGKGANEKRNSLCSNK